MERRWSLFLELHEAVMGRQGPGSDASTLRALDRIADLPEAPRIVDFGCGPGAASLLLAERTGGHVVAVDTHRPFLDHLEEQAARRGLAGRVDVLEADMLHAGLPEASFDLVWSEGAVYNVGFGAGVAAWRPLLREGGWLAVSEVVWTVDDPPPGASAFWEAEYPQIGRVDERLEDLRSAGFEPRGHDLLPPEDWAAYYTAHERALAAFLARHAGDPDALAVAEAEREEYATWQRFGSAWTYAFFVARNR